MLEHSLLTHPSEEILCVGELVVLCFGGLFSFSLLVLEACLGKKKHNRYL